MTAAVDAWAQLAGPAKVLAAARLLVEERHTGPAVTVRVDLDKTERAQVAKLLGLAWNSSGDSVKLGRLTAALTRAGDDLTALLVRLGGDLDDRPAEKARKAADAKAAVDSAYQELTDAGIPAHAVDLARERRWLERRAAPIPGRAKALARLWQALPGNGRPLPEFANQLFQDPHALDRDAELGRAAARLLAAADAPTDPAEAAKHALTGDRWRAVWAEREILCDQVSSTVLVLNLRLTGPSPAAAIATAGAGCGEPVWLTARSLRGRWHPTDAAVVVRVCENPAIVEAAANRHGAAGMPLVCIYGRPSVAAWMLLRGLAAAGTRLLATADRDKAGQQFLTELLTLTTATEWLPDANGIYEEARLDELLADLAPGRGPA
ncbi:TIGR02679 domain-containing protein [Micromonospora sp. NPDC049060]|uniref:TIGR02679 domain-containing protein n=1 Tax=Micromonospora sp. NPDC049060 TaxID=3154828 RepID=UPI0033D88013